MQLLVLCAYRRMNIILELCIHVCKMNTYMYLHIYIYIQRAPLQRKKAKVSQTPPRCSQAARTNSVIAGYLKLSPEICNDNCFRPVGMSHGCIYWRLIARPIPALYVRKDILENSGGSPSRFKAQMGLMLRFRAQSVGFQGSMLPRESRSALVREFLKPIQTQLIEHLKLHVSHVFLFLAAPLIRNVEYRGLYWADIYGNSHEGAWNLCSFPHGQGFTCDALRPDRADRLALHASIILRF